VRFFDRMAVSHTRIAEDYQRRDAELCKPARPRGRYKRPVLDTPRRRLEAEHVAAESVLAMQGASGQGKKGKRTPCGRSAATERTAGSFCYSFPFRFRHLT
jgi:hypothetical protein